ncbi:alpha/beta hydrolase [Halobacteriovorax sp. DA5]|uniref:alpha/beta hydrolase n=1 Tax=Halobacteriovorax sp. DA5 TaxID=2067553 RepID=UPI000CD121F2|nr:alpha/beta hydrolase [Halobacteriovorax sp. DA5]POB12542.1 hypothetical protein C0Z22_14550 [Halobacteriovorax sp. DA5]
MKDIYILKDNLKTCFRVSGAESGKPVLYINGAGMSGSLNFYQEDLINNNIKLYSIDRPGFGQSDFNEDKSFSSITESVELLLRELKLDQIDAIAFSQGAPFLYHMCLHGIVKKAVIVSGQDDLHYKSTYELLDENTKGFVNSVSSGQLTCDEFQKTFNLDGFIEFVIGTSSEVDKKVYTQDSYKKMYGECLQEGIGSSFESYYQDLFMCLSPWGFNLEEVTTDVFHLYGKHDYSPVHSPDFGETLTQRNSNFTAEVIDSVGGALIWTHGSYILKGLCYN